MLNVLLLAITMACTPMVPAEDVIVYRDSEAYAAYPELAEEMAALTVTLRGELQLDMWRINIHFADSIPQWAASTNAAPGYYVAVITYDLSNFDGSPDALKLEAVAHELFHIMTWETDEVLLQMAYDRGDPELFKRVRILREQLATRLSRNFIARR